MRVSTITDSVKTAAALVICLLPASRSAADITVGGDRPTTVLVPETYDPAVPAPLVIALHGLWRESSSPAAISESWVRMAPVAREHGVLLAYPESRFSGSEWRWSLTGEDPAYIRALIDEARSVLRVDTDRIGVFGFSRGAQFAYQLACENADILAAFVAAAGPRATSCSAAPVPALAIVGTEDSRFADSVSSIETWAASNGCSLAIGQSAMVMDLITDRPGPDTTRRPFEGCDGGVSAELWTIVGGVHTPSWTANGRSTRLAVEVNDWLLAHPRRPSPVATIGVEPASGPYPLEVTLSGSASTPPGGDAGAAIAGYHWSLGDGERATGEFASHTFSRPGLYSVALQVVTEDERVSRRAQETVEVLCPSGDVTPWRTDSVGGSPYAGAALFETEEGSDLFLCAGAYPVTSRSDGWLFLHQEATGDFRLTTRVVEVAGEPSGSTVAVALMARAGLEADAAFAAALLEIPAGGSPLLRGAYRLNDRVTARSGTVRERIDEAATWLRLERRGNTLVSLGSVDGQGWTELHAETFAGLPATLELGIGLADQVPASLPRTEFEAVRIQVSELTLGPLPAEPIFLRGDDNDDGSVNPSDAILSLEFQFLGRGAPACLAALDTNADAAIDISDPIYNLAHQFLGRPDPPPPYPGCGPESLPPEEALPCETPPGNCP